MANSVSTFPAGSVAWSAATSDQRYISVSNSTVNGYQIYATNGTYFWAPAGAASAGTPYNTTQLATNNSLVTFVPSAPITNLNGIGSGTNGGNLVVNGILVASNAFLAKRASAFWPITTDTAIDASAAGTPSSAPIQTWSDSNHVVLAQISSNGFYQGGISNVAGSGAGTNNGSFIVTNGTLFARGGILVTHGASFWPTTSDPAIDSAAGGTASTNVIQQWTDSNHVALAWVNSNGVASFPGLYNSGPASNRPLVLEAVAGGQIVTNLPAPSDGQTYVADSTQPTGWKATNFPAGGSGSVTSVGLSLPAYLTVSGSPVTTTGTLTAVGNGTQAPFASVLATNGIIDNGPTTNRMAVFVNHTLTNGPSGTDGQAIVYDAATPGGIQGD